MLIFKKIIPTLVIISVSLTSYSFTLDEYLTYSVGVHENIENHDFIASQCSISYKISELKAIAKLSESGNQVTINAAERLSDNDYQMTINYRASNYKIESKIISKNKFDNDIYCVAVGSLNTITE